MRLYKFVPSEYKDDAGKKALKEWEGHIMLRPPTFDEAFGYLEKCGISYDAEGNVESEKNTTQQMRIMVECSRPHYQEVGLKNKTTGEMYETLEDLDLDPDCRGLLCIVAAMVIKGFKPSKNLKAPSDNK